MKYIDSNKKTWEEAFDLKDPDWGKDIVYRVQTEDYPFFEKEMVLVLAIKKYSFEQKVLVHFCSNNGRELLSLVNSAHAKQGYAFDIAENQVSFAFLFAKGKRNLRLIVFSKQRIF